MICINCRAGEHSGCRGGTWCNCQHRVPEPPVDPRPTPGREPGPQR